MKKEVIVRKPNQLISILPKESISLIQQKSYNVFLRNAQNKVKYTDEKIREDKRYIFEMSCKELEKKAGVNKKDYDYIEEELQKLMSIVIKVLDKENKDDWKLFHLIDEIDKENNMFRYVLNPLIVKALKEQTYFTKLNLLEIAKLDSKYSVIFYELAIRYYNNKRPEIKIPKMNIEELRQRTNTEHKYLAIKDLRKYVLDKACKEISEKTDIKLSYTTEKIGRRIAYVDFKTQKKEKKLIKQLPKALPTQIEVKKQEYSPQVLELFKLLPLSEQVESNKRELAKLLKDHSFRYLRADIDYAQSSKPDNFMGFVKASCQSNHYSSAELEKEEQKKELARKREEKKQRRKEMEDKIRQKAKEKAIGKYEQLSSEELKGYGSSYNNLPKMLKGKVSKREFIIGAIEEEMEKEIREILVIIED